MAFDTILIRMRYTKTYEDYRIYICYNLDIKWFK